MNLFTYTMLATLFLVVWGTLFAVTLVIRNIKRIEARLDDVESRLHDVEGDCQ